MAAEVKGIECPSNKWTPLSIGKAKVLAVVRDFGDGKIVVGAAAPTGEPSNDYLTLNNTRPVSLQFQDASTNVYVWPVSAALVVEVVRE